MPIQAMRVKQSTDTTGTGTLTLNAAPSAARSFNAAFGGSSVLIQYVISWASGFEYGYGTFNGGSPGTLTRTAVIGSSNSNALVSLPPGTKDVFAWVDSGQRAVTETTATTVNLSVVHLGNLLMWAGTSAGTANLPAIAGIPIGAGLEIGNGGTAVLTLDGNASETINGLATLRLVPGDAVTLRRVTAGWVSSTKPAWGLIADTAVTAINSLEITWPPSMFRLIRVWLTHVLPASTGATINLFSHIRVGGAWQTGGSAYETLWRVQDNSSQSIGGNTASAFYLGNGGTNSANDHQFVSMDLDPGASGAEVGMIAHTRWSNNSGRRAGDFYGAFGAGGPVDGVRFIWEGGGNFSAVGRVIAMGIKA